MTPLAAHIFGTLTDPVALRPRRPNDLIRHYENLHRFECSSIYPSIDDALTGRRTYVRAHWRGDPSLGMKRTRYRVN